MKAKVHKDGGEGWGGGRGGEQRKPAHNELIQDYPTKKAGVKKKHEEKGLLTRRRLDAKGFNPHWKHLRERGKKGVCGQSRQKKTRN